VTVRSSVRRRRRRGAWLLPWVARLVVVALVFAAGVALGQALEDRPQPAEPVTSFATIQPWTQTETATETRTVTVPTP
jgi:hypothetical protein